jgi:ubiquinone/menaquinone biosynthesis C-methylase UbiE
VGLYGDHVLPRLLNAACGSKELHELRERACAGLAGDIVEIGFGSGLNISHYPRAVTRVDAVDPADASWRMAADRIKASPIPIHRIGVDAQDLPAPDGAYDAALVTWTLCTVPDATAALSELHRVLRRGGHLHFMEHGLAPDEKVRRFQRRVEPLHRRLVGGCRVTRQIVELIKDAGFTVTELDTFYEAGAPKYAGALSLGVAVVAAPAKCRVVG